MECSVCYSESGPFQKLCCGHVFCKGCIKSWYLKGVNGTACPMCRSPIYWSGFHKVRDEWNEEAYENKCAEVFGQALDEAFEEAQGFAEQFPPRWRPRIFRDVIEDFIDIEKTYRFLRWHDAHPDEIEDVFYYGDYYSDKRVGKHAWDDEPPKEWVSRYPGVSSAPARCGSRRRAAEDEWCTLSFYIAV
jgi:hypothetical protein